MTDLIDRQTAIDTLDKHLRTTDVPVSYPGIISALTEWLNELPSAQPEIVRCKDCKNRGDDDCPMRFIEWVEYDDDGYIEYDDIIHDFTKDDGFCDRAERREE